MIAETHFNRAPAVSPSQSLAVSGNPTYLSIGKASKLIGVSIQSLREWERAGRIHSYRTIGNRHGHRRFLVRELIAQCLPGVAGETAVDEGKKVCVYCRVSSQSQARTGSLSRQTERMIETVAKREGIEQGAVKLYKDVASSFGERQGLNNLVDDLIAGKVKRIYVEHQDRLSRVPALTRMVEHLCRANNVELIALDRDEQVDEQAANLQELIEFVTVLSNRASSRKQAERSRRVLTPEGLEFIRQHLASGRSVEQTCKMANEQGYKTVQGGPIGLKVIYRYMSKVVQRLVPLEKVENSFETFVAAHLKKKRGENNKVQAAALHMAYNNWARKAGITPLSSKKCGRFLRDNGFVYATVRGFTYYENVELIGYGNVVEVNGGPRTRVFWNGIKVQVCHYAGRKPKTGKQRNPKQPQ